MAGTFPEEHATLILAAARPWFSRSAYYSHRRSFGIIHSKERVNMSKLMLYHGSDKRIEQPVFGAGNLRNDYGRGFYCTEHINMANEWAVERDRDGFTNCYHLNTSGLSVLNLNTSEYTILHWLAVLLENRVFDLAAPLPLEAREYLLATFSVDYENADIMRGYRADDSYFSFAQDFLNGLISFQQLSRAMYLGNLGEQIVLKSEAAFDSIEFVSANPVAASEWFPLREARDSQARRQYFDVERNRRSPEDLYILHILDERIGPHDPRIRS